MPEAPYMYAHSSASSAYPQSIFDPKAVSRASLISAAPRPKLDGPLIDLNRHPDSWQIKPLTKPEYDPMHPKIKKIITVVRKLQLALRLLVMLVAVGVLFCVITIKGLEGTNAWVMRITPGADIIITTYAIWHLARNINRRTPASSASYHFFALVMDTGSVPFYIFIVWLVKPEYFMKANSEGRWTTMFSTDSFKGVSATNIILHATWLLGIVAASLHGVLFVISSWLAYIFREIAQMPPDLNPLEDNLTSRRKTKHRYKNSEVTSEKHLSQTSDSSFSGPRLSRISAPTSPHHNGRPISFLHTRTESEIAYSPHNPRTAVASRADGANIYQQLPSSRASRADLGAGNSGEQHSAGSTHLKSMSSSLYSDAVVPEVPPKSDRREILSDNWFVSNANKENYTPRGNDASYEICHQPGWMSIPTKSQNNLQHDQSINSQLRPLGMNPPTPRPGSAATNASMRNDVADSHRHTTASRALTRTSGNPQSTGVSSVAAPKSKYYGDLMSATNGIRGASPTQNSNANSRKSQGTGRSAGNPNWHDDRGRVVSNTGIDAKHFKSYVEDDLNTWGGNGRRDVSGKIVEEGRGGDWDGWRRRASGKLYE